MDGQNRAEQFAPEMFWEMFNFLDAEKREAD
jgi:hypothetical protein